MKHRVPSTIKIVSSMSFWLLTENPLWTTFLSFQNKRPASSRATITMIDMANSKSLWIIGRRAKDCFRCRVKKMMTWMTRRRTHFRKAWYCATHRTWAIGTVKQQTHTEEVHTKKSAVRMSKVVQTLALTQWRLMKSSKCHWLPTSPTSLACSSSTSLQQ